MTSKELVENLSQVPGAAIFCWAAYREFVAPKPAPLLIVILARAFRVIFVIVTFGMLAGCANSDPLAVASGPLFPLNVGHWQPSPQDLAVPPVVAHD
jgi:hypothetical protein